MNSLLGCREFLSRNWYALSLHRMYPMCLSLRLSSWCFGFRFVLEVLVFFLGWCLVSDLYLRYLSSSVGGVCVCLMGVPVDRSVRLTLFLACGCSFASHYFLLLSVVWGTMMTCLREVLLIWWVSSFFIGVVRSLGYLNAFFLRFTLFLQVPPHYC